LGLDQWGFQTQKITFYNFLSLFRTFFHFSSEINEVLPLCQALVGLRGAMDYPIAVGVVLGAQPDKKKHHHFS